MLLRKGDHGTVAMVMSHHAMAVSSVNHAPSST